jgi:hypothetical protein
MCYSFSKQEKLDKSIEQLEKATTRADRAVRPEKSQLQLLFLLLFIFTQKQSESMQPVETTSNESVHISHISAR